MARSKGILKIEGTLQDMTFYNTSDGNLVKMKSSVNKQRISTDPAFARTRENGAEFGQAAKSGKLLRGTLRNLMLNTADKRVTSRVTQIMTQIKNLDTVSERGKRTVGIGIANAAGLARLKDLNFNKQAILSSVLFAPYKIDAASGTISIDNFIPKNDVTYPAGTTHISLQSAMAVINFTSGDNDISVSPAVVLSVDNISTNVQLKPANIPTVIGSKLNLLHLSFFQEINGVQYPLKSGNFNVLSIVEVG